MSSPRQPREYPRHLLDIPGDTRLALGRGPDGAQRDEIVAAVTSR